MFTTPIVMINRELSVSLNMAMMKSNKSNTKSVIHQLSLLDLSWEVMMMADIPDSMVSLPMSLSELKKESS